MLGVGDGGGGWGAQNCNRLLLGMLINTTQKSRCWFCLGSITGNLGVVVCNAHKLYSCSIFQCESEHSKIIDGKIDSFSFFRKTVFGEVIFQIEGNMSKDQDMPEY